MKRYLPISILFIGIVLRWYGINWSLPHIFHPDETRLLYAVSDISLENLNPKFFAYGSLPIYLLKIVHVATESLAGFLGKPSYVNFFLTGRAVSAFFGSLTLIILYLLGKRAFSPRVGLLSAAFLAFTVLHIQLSHFLTVDVMLTFFVVFALYVLALLIEGHHPLRYYLLTGTVLGLALATKISALPLYGVFLVAHILLLRQSKWTAFPKGHSSLTLWGMFVLAILLSGVIFFLCEPYALLDYNEFYRQIKEQSDMVRGITQPPYVIQYEGTSRYWYQLQQLLRFAMGIPLGLLTLIGTIFLLLKTLRWLLLSLTRRPPHSTFRIPQALILVFAWVLPVCVITGGFQVKFLRYMLPLIPFFCLLGAVFIEDLLLRSSSWRFVVYPLVIITLVFSVFYSIAFITIYHREDPRAQASRWIYNHLEEGSTLLTELWEFSSIVPINGHHPTQYRMLQLDLYGPDTDAKIQRMTEQLSETDVIILATRRLYGSILRVPERYPLTSNYYKLLFDGTLGFRSVAPFTKYPSLIEIRFNDDFADESFSVYDHPKTLLFQKVNDIPAQDLYTLIISAPPVENSDSLLKRFLAFPALERENVPFIQPSLQEKKRSVVDQSSVAEKGAVFQWQAIFLWLITVELLALIVFPFTSLTFRNLPDKGYAVAKVVGILLPSYFIWLCVSMGFFSYSQQNILFTTCIILFLALYVFLKDRQFFANIFRTGWKTFLVYEGVFLSAFAAFILFRAYNPDIFWSESSMDFSFLTVLNRTDTLPPPDPWISGFPLNYYYFGHYLVATLTKLTGIPPQFTYNLAFALFPALVILELFSLLYNLTKRYLIGIVSVLFSSVIGNLDGFLLFLDMLRKKELGYRFFRPAHEVIPYTVHEFPSWTFIFVDLHAHLLNMPFLIATFLIGLNLLFVRRTVRSEEHFESFSPIRLIPTLLYLLLVGTLGVISSWDYPTGVIFLVLIACITAYKNHYRSGQRWKSALRPLAYIAAIIIPGSLVLYAPFYSSFSRSGMGIGLVGKLTTELSDFLTIFGFFFFLIFSYLLLQARQIRFFGHPWRALLILLIGGFAIYTFAFYRFQLNYATLLFVFFTLLFSTYIFFKTDNLRSTNVNVPHLYIWLCLLYACMISAGCEIIFVRDFLQDGEYKRMNTIFKFYIPAWFLFSFVATYSFAQILRLFKHHISGTKIGVFTFWKILWSFCFGLLLLFSLTFPVMGVYARRHQQDVYGRTYLPPTLDGLAYIKTQNPDEYHAIGWLNTNISGTPVILEATGPDYRYEYGRISANTGLPTVLGWQSHADQREHWHRTYQRVQDVKEIYTNPNINRVMQLLRHYGVQYIYIGYTEGRDFSIEDLQKFQQYPEYFEPVFQSGDTVIYQVRYE